MTVISEGAAHGRPGWWERLRIWWRTGLSTREDGWTEMEQRVRSDSAPGWVEELDTEPEPAPAPAPRPLHPPFAMQQPYMMHVLDRMQHLLVDLRRDPAMTAVKAATALAPLANELTDYARQESDRERRMAANQQAAAAQRVLLEDAVRRNVPDPVGQAQSGIVGRAVHVGDEHPTRVDIPPITEDMPDPRTVARPRDVNPGDVEPGPDQSPVREPGKPMPLPEQEFTGGEPDPPVE